MTQPVLLISHGSSAEAKAMNQLAREAGVTALTDTAGQVVELACRFQPRLIVLDIHQMAGQGLEMLAHLRQNPTTRHMPVVVTAREADDFAQSVCEELGVSLFITQPSAADLMPRVLALLSAARAAHEAA